MNITERAGRLLGDIEALGFKLVGVTGPNAAMLWGSVVPLFEKHRDLWEPHESLDQIRDYIVSKRGQLWVLFEGDEVILLMVTKTEIEPSGLRVFTIPYLIGRGFFTEPKVTNIAMEYVEAYALSGGCSLMRALTFERIAEHLKVFGFESTRHVVEKSIINLGALN